MSEAIPRSNLQAVIVDPPLASSIGASSTISAPTRFQTSHLMNGPLQIQIRNPAGFRRTGTGKKSRIENIQIQGKVNRNATKFFDCVFQMGKIEGMLNHMDFGPCAFLCSHRTNAKLHNAVITQDLVTTP